MTLSPDDAEDHDRPSGTKLLRLLLAVAAVISAVVVLVGGITKTSRSLDELTSAAARRSALAESKGYECLEAALRRGIPRGAKVFDGSGHILLYQRIAELLTPGYTLVGDAAHAQYVVYVRPGTTCGLYRLFINRGGVR